MKTILLAFVFGVAAAAADISVSFNYNFTGATPCSATVTTNCIEKFEVGILTGAVFNTQVSVPLPANPTGQVNGISGAFAYQATFGTQTIAAVAVAKDATGQRITSDPTKATAVVTITPSSPKNIVVVVGEH